MRLFLRPKILLLSALIITISSDIFAVNPSVEDIIYDVYTQMSEQGEVDYEELQSRLMELNANPINLRHCSVEQLRQLPFLSEQQVDEICLYETEHGFDRVEELQLVRGMDEYTIRDLSYFVYIGDRRLKKTYPSDIFRYATHEISLRTDVRNLETYRGDPFFGQVRYKFNYQNRVQFGFTLRRDAGAAARDMLYGGYVQLTDWGPMRRIVLGNYDAEFGCGLVSGSSYRMGKSNYVTNVGYREQGLRSNTSVTTPGLHGVGATGQLLDYRGHRLHLSGWYSLTRSNDSIRRHVIGANLTYRWRRLHVGVTAVEKIYTDSVYPATNMYYNRAYFRGRNQCVLGANVRYNWGIVDLFSEAAMAQSSWTVLSPRWGGAVNVGARLYPVEDVSIMALYRYYSPTYDNDLGYGFSETNRVGDENGGYLAVEVTRWRGLRVSGYVDGYYFSGPKYRIRESGTWGLEGQIQAEYTHAHAHRHLLRWRGRLRAGTNRLEGRYVYTWSRGGWVVSVEADGVGRSTGVRHLGGAILGDVEYTFRRVPLALRGRVAGFHVSDWDNRLYIYEHDVLYAGMIPAVYGVGGRGYINLRAQLRKAKPAIALYARASFTLYSNDWCVRQRRPYRTDTDIHVSMRMTW